MKKKISIIGLILLVILAGSFIYFRFFQKNKSIVTSSGNVDQSDFPLQIGSVGENVKKLQRWCNSKLKESEQGLKLTVDGIFGNKTYDVFGWVTAVDLNGVSTSIFDKCTYDFFMKNKIYNY